MSYRNTLRLSFLLTITTVVNVVAETPPGIPDGWTNGYAYTNGIRVHYYQTPHVPGKPVMIMVHGVTDIGLNWTTLTWKLQDDFNIYMLDARGHGLSDPFTDSDNGNTLTEDLLAFIKSKGIDKPILIGHSMGAATVMRLGSKYPDIPGAVIILDPFLGDRRPPSIREDAPKQDADNGSDPTSDELEWRMMGTPEELIEQNNYDYDALVAKARRENPKWDLVDCQYWALSKKQYHGVYSWNTWRAMSHFMDTGVALANIEAPALILKADAPKEARDRHFKAVKVMQNGRLIHLDGTAHNLHHDDVERTNSLIRDFLADL